MFVEARPQMIRGATNCVAICNLGDALMTAEGADDEPVTAVLTLTIRQHDNTIEGLVAFGDRSLGFEGWAGLGTAVQACLDQAADSLVRSGPRP
jgi:hypothetical protein